MNVFSLEKKLCENAQKYLDAYTNNELLVETNQEVLRHLETCKSCSEALQTRLRVKARLKEAVKSDGVPAGLRERIQSALRDENFSERKTTPWAPWSLAAAAVLVMCLGGWGTLHLWKLHRTSSEMSQVSQDLTLSEQIASVLRIGIGDHVHCVIDSHFDKEIMTPEQMAQAMGPDYSGLIPLLKEKLPEGFVISAGHRCQVKGREFIHMVLKHEDQAVSLIITEKQGVSFPASKRVNSAGAQGVSLHQDRLDLLEAVGFETQSHLAFVVSSFDHKENFHLASELAPAVSGFLNRI
jgi:Putative zinc-finger